MGFASESHGGVGVFFELRSAGRPRIKGLTKDAGGELVLHPFFSDEDRECGQ
jgi:hypothetical protein